MERFIHIRDDIGIAARVIQRNNTESARFFVEHSIMLFVQKGTKILRWENKECVIAEGEGIAIAAGRRYDFINLLSDDGNYDAVWLALDKRIIAAHVCADHHGQVINDPLPIRDIEPAFRASFERALEAVAIKDEIPSPVAQHRLSEVLIWINLHGGCFRPLQSVSVSDRVRSMLSAQPANNWNALDVACRLAMSEATLRRRMASEGISFSELLIDVRMSYALTLLQSTELPISRISMDVGYESASRFAARFNKRFGFAPRTVRGYER